MNRLVPLLLCLITLTAVCQKITVTKGPVIDEKAVIKQTDMAKRVRIVSLRPKPTGLSSALFFDTNEKKAYGGIGMNKGAFYFMSYNNYVNPGTVTKLSAEFVKEGDKETLRMIALVARETQRFMLHTVEFPEQNKFSLYVNELDSKMQLTGTPIVISTFNDLKKSGSDFDVEISKNKQYLLLTRILDQKAKEKQKLECLVLDASFAIVWKTELVSETMDKNLDVEVCQVDDSGNAYVLAERTVKSDKRPVLMSYLWQTRTLRTSEAGLEEGDNYGTNIEMVGGQPYLVGLNKKKKDVVYFVNRFDAQSGTLSLLSSTPMPDDFYEGATFGIKAPDCSVVNLVSLENGDLVASIEGSVVASRNGKPYQWASVHVVAIAFTADGKPKWTHTVRKLQALPLGEYIGHALLPAKNKVMILYNDDPSNVKLDPLSKKVDVFKNVKTTMMMVQEIDTAGKAKKYSLSKDAALANYNLEPGKLIRIEEGLYFMSMTRIKNAFNVDTRAVTLKIE